MTTQRRLLAILLVLVLALPASGCYRRDVYYHPDGSVTVVEERSAAGAIVGHIVAEIFLHALFCH